ncbi:MAG: DUF6265 family protein [Phycisphaerales bacterium]
MITTITACLGLVLGATTLQPDTTERFTLEDVAFIAGHWEGPLFGGHAEEVWLAPDGGTMLGMFRLVSKNREGAERTSVIEYLLFTQTDDGVTFRFKHFRTDYTTWETGEPLTFDLVEAGDNSAVFASDIQSQPDRMTFRIDAEGKLRVLVEGEENGKRDAFEAVYSRVE